MSISSSPCDSSNFTAVGVDMNVWNRTYSSNDCLSSEGYTGNSSDLYDAPYTVVCVVLNALIFLIGMLGNIMVVCVVVWSKSMRTPTNCYLLSLAVADCLVLIAATLPAIPEPFFQKKEWPWGRAMCSVLVFLQYLGPNASSLSITAFTVERYIAICHPMRAHTMCTVNRAKKIIVILWVFTLLYCSPWIGLTTTNSVISQGRVLQDCTFRMKRSTYLAYYVIDLLALYVTPLILAAAMYGSIARALFRTLPPDSGLLGSFQGRNDLERGCSRQIKRTRTNSRIQVVRMLVVIVLVFALAWLPYRALVVYNSLAKERFVNQWFLLFCRLMIYLNSAINPILYNAMSVKFRRAYTRCLCCKTDCTRSPKRDSAANQDRTKTLCILFPLRTGSSYTSSSHRPIQPSNGTNL